MNWPTNAMAYAACGSSMAADMHRTCRSAMPGC
jgi:hypothetical protein